MDASIGNQPFQGDAGNFTTEWIERRQDDRLGRVINNHIHAGGSFKGTDVASLPSDDPPLHLIALDVQHADGGFDRMISGGALDGLDDKFLGFSAGFIAGGIADFLQHQGGFSTSLIRHILDQLPLGIFAGQPGQTLQPGILLDDHALHFLLTEIERLRAFVHLPFEPDLLAFFPAQQFDFAIDILFANVEGLFLRAQFVAFRLNVGIKVLLLLIPFILDFEELLAFEGICFFCSIIEELFCTLLCRSNPDAGDAIRHNPAYGESKHSGTRKNHGQPDTEIHTTSIVKIRYSIKQKIRTASTLQEGTDERTLPIQWAPAGASFTSTLSLVPRWRKSSQESR